MFQVNVVHHLLFALSNTSYTNSQRESCAALQVRNKVCLLVIIIIIVIIVTLRQCVIDYCGEGPGIV